MKNNKKVFVTSIVILLIALLGIGGYKIYANSQKVKGNKNITIKVIDENKNYKKEYNLNTNVDTLGKTLDELGIAKAQNSQFGRYVDVLDGIVANKDKNEWWKIKVNEVDAQTGIDETFIKNGDIIKFEFTVGF